MMSPDSSDKILVTGGTGFIGRHLVRELIKDGHRPMVLTRNASALAETGVEHIEADLLDLESIEKLIEKIRPEIVFHLAGRTQHDNKIFELNFTATRNLLLKLAVFNVKRIVLLGTADEYGNQPIPFREDMALQPVSEYARSKAEIAKLALEKGMPVTILRIFTVYGPWQPPQMFLNQLINHAILKHHFNMTDGAQKRDYVYIEDVAKAVKLAGFSDNVNGRVINIGSGQTVQLSHLAQKAWKMCGADEKFLHIGARTKPAEESFDTLADVTLAKNLLGWQVETSLDEGLRKTIEYAKAQNLETK